ncbi:MAG: caspase family protein [Bacteroidales bacterium]|nr:caspase family protein [Bacteroidales bacterium]
MRKLLIIILILVPFTLNGQNAKAYLKAAEQYIQNGYLEDAIDQYQKALSLEPENGNIYELRAIAFQKTGNLPSAAEDFKNAAVFNTNPAQNYLYASEIKFQLGAFPEAELLVNKAIDQKPKLYEAYILKCQINLALSNFNEALSSAEKAIDARNTAFALFLKGKTELYLEQYQSAEQSLEKAIIKDKLLLDAYLTLAEIQYKTGKIRYGIENCSFVISNDREQVAAYVLRSKGHILNHQPEQAIRDISIAISMDSTNTAYYILRGDFYQNLSQFQNAINDYTLALGYDMLEQTALRKRANAYEMIGQRSKAASDLALVMTLADKTDLEQMAELEGKIYELNREGDKPLIILSQPARNDNMDVLVAKDLESIEILVNVEDQSKLKFFRINNDTLINDAEGINKKAFSHLIKTNDLEFLTLSAMDIYNNSTTQSFAVERIETHPPNITLLNPYVGDEGIIIVDQDDRSLYLEGKIDDESLITSIQIDEVTASYVPRDNNPRFTATLDIRNKNRLRIAAKDAYGNHVEKEYLIQREGNAASLEDPMGKTWVILIENSEYADFANLASPKNDVKLMQEGLSRYQIDKVIVKRNLTKREMERFFSIDLRDLVRINQVNSLFIWFAGHGINKNGVGYWIPSDARKEVEFSYYNINALKASLYSYTTLTHLLVVSDACETGPGFCQLLRSPIENVSCNQSQLFAKKSAQVFTSAGDGYAYDNSLFTRSFANTLLNNEDDCLSIEDIAKRVSIILENSSPQKPEFGRISGIQDELGTFFFFTK